LAEAQLRNALSIGEGSWLVFVQRPGTIFLLLVVAAVLLLPRIARRVSARRAAAAPA
jgi:putative tricarboxylic transport membrane protein